MDNNQITEKELGVFLGSHTGWNIRNSSVIEKDYIFRDFKNAIAFINRIAEIAERENHHPDMSLYSYKQVTVRLTTHDSGGITESDLMLASMIDEIIERV